MFQIFLLESLVLLLVRNGDGTLSETVSELSPDHLEVSHTASASHLSADGLLRPVVLAHASTGVTT